MLNDLTKTPVKDGAVDGSVPGLSTDDSRVPENVPGRQWSAQLLLYLERYMLVLLLAFVVLGFSLAKPDLYPTLTNLQNVVGSQSVLVVAALAAMMPLVTGHFDLSIGAIVALSTVATGAALSAYAMPVPLALLGAVAIGGAAGGLNGYIVAKLGVNSLITTIGTASIISGLLQLYTNGETIVGGIPQSLTNIGTQIWLGLPQAVFPAVAVAMLVWYALEHTPFGRHLYSVGSNPNAARLVGLPVQRLVIASFVAAGLLAGAAGALNVARSGVANPASGPDFTLPVFAAVFLGASAVRPGRFNVPGTIVALLFLAASVTGLTFLQAGAWVAPVFNGSGLVIGVALATIIARKRARQ